MCHQSAQTVPAANYVRQLWPVVPRVGIILGTGLGRLVDEMQQQTRIPYRDIPGFGTTTATGHRGQLVCGYLHSVPVVAMQGRFHLYEGYGAHEASRPVRVMKRLGIDTLIVTNASGGLNPCYRSGDVMILEDHINLMWRNPLIGSNDDTLGPRFPDMSCPYDATLRRRAAASIECHQGVYAAMAGPTYETRAEYRMLRKLGADVVGMSTVPETLAAVHAGLRVLGLSAVTNLCRPDTLESTSGDMVREAAEMSEPRIGHIVKHVVAQFL